MLPKSCFYLVTDGADWLKTCSLHQETLLIQVLAHVCLKQNRDCPMPQVECSDNPDDVVLQTLLLVYHHLRISVCLVYNEQHEGADKEIALFAHLYLVVEVDNRGVAA